MLWLLLTSCVWISERHHAEELDADGDGLSVFADCDDADAAIGGPSAVYVDRDGDGYGAGESLQGCPGPGLTSVDGDCDDLRSEVHPDAEELCDPLGIDEDCDGAINDDDDDAMGLRAVLTDADGDGYGAGEAVAQACAPGPGQALLGGDCDDADPAVSPGQPERCGGGDEDCDDDTDEPGALGERAWFPDDDGDGWGRTEPVTACEAPAGPVEAGGDCDDADVGVHPQAPEQCDGRDDDCNGLIDDAVTSWADDDGDGYGAGTGAAGCAPGRVANDGDCDDRLADVHPGATPTGGDVDHDCDGLVDADSDGDGYSDEAMGGSDCDDADPDVTPDAGCPASAPSCRVLYERGETADRVYTLAGDPPYDALCDLSGGGWTLLGREAAGSASWTAPAVENTVPFGAPLGSADHKSAAYVVLPVTEVRFVDGDGMWARYVLDAVPTPVVERMLATPRANCEPGIPMVEGDLAHPALCDTALYIHPHDQDGRSCNNSTYAWDAVGFAWSRSHNNGCPLDDPDGSSFIHPDVPWAAPLQLWGR